MLEAVWESCTLPAADGVVGSAWQATGVDRPRIAITVPPATGICLLKTS